MRASSLCTIFLLAATLTLPSCAKFKGDMGAPPTLDIHYPRTIYTADIFPSVTNDAAITNIIYRKLSEINYRTTPDPFFHIDDYEQLLPDDPRLYAIAYKHMTQNLQNPFPDEHEFFFKKSLSIDETLQQPDFKNTEKAQRIRDFFNKPFTNELDLLYQTNVFWNTELPFDYQKAETLDASAYQKSVAPLQELFKRGKAICSEQATTKYLSLRKSGIPDEQLYYLYVMKGKAAHAVLGVVMKNGKMMILNNLGSKTPDDPLRYSSSMEPNALASASLFFGPEEAQNKSQTGCRLVFAKHFGPPPSLFFAMKMGDGISLRYSAPQIK